MSCGCKDVRDTSVPDAKLMNSDKRIDTNHIFKWVIFFGMVILTPLFIPFLVYFLYKLIIKTENFNATFMLKSSIELIKTHMIVNKEFDVDSADLEIYDGKSQVELLNV